MYALDDSEQGRFSSSLTTKSVKTVKSYHFSDETDLLSLSCSSSSDDSSSCDLHVCDDSCLNVKLIEVLNPNYGMFTWPSASILAQYIWHNRQKVKNKVILELGAGTGLPSIVAAKCNAYVIWSDFENPGEVIKYGEENFELNNISDEKYEMQEVTWGNFSPSLLCSKPVHIILGSDVFYDIEDFEDLLVTIAFLMHRNPNAEFWCLYQERCPDWNISYLLQQWGLYCQEEVPLNTFNARKCRNLTWDLPSDDSFHFFIFKCNDIQKND